MTKKAIEEVYELVSKIEVGIEIETSGKNMMEVINQILKHLLKKLIIKNKNGKAITARIMVQEFLRKNEIK